MSSLSMEVQNWCKNPFENPLHPFIIPFAGSSAALYALGSLIFSGMTAGVGALYGVFHAVMHNTLMCAVNIILNRMPNTIISEKAKNITYVALFVITFFGSLALAALVISSMNFGLPFTATFITGLKIYGTMLGIAVGIGLLRLGCLACCCTLANRQPPQLAC